MQLSIALAVCQFLQKSFPAFGNRVNILESLNTDRLRNDLQLFLGTLAFHEGFPEKHFRKNAPHTPHINRRSVIITAQQKLWRPVPSCRYVICQFVAFRFVNQRPCQTEVTYFQVAVFVDQ
jgi:hypothetical protein